MYITIYFTVRADVRQMKGDRSSELSELCVDQY